MKAKLLILKSLRKKTLILYEILPFFFFCINIIIIFLVLENIRNVLQLYCFPSYAYHASFLVSTVFK